MRLPSNIFLPGKDRTVWEKLEALSASIALTPCLTAGSSMPADMFVKAQPKRIAAVHLLAAHVVCRWAAWMVKRRPGGWASMTR
jgi:hypothetical protein